MYIVIEGQDGTGKSTQAELLKKYFEGQGKKVVMLEEPDGDLPQAHDLHDMILTRGYNLCVVVYCGASGTVEENC